MSIYGGKTNFINFVALYWKASSLLIYHYWDLSPVGVQIPIITTPRN